MIRRLAVLALVPLLAVGCSTKSIREKLTPKASVLGVSIVELTPHQATLKVDVKTDDVDLMLGMVKMKYKITILETEHGSDHVATSELLNLSDSGFAFLIRIPLDQSQAATKLSYLLQGSIVFKVIAKIADVPFSYQGDLALNP
ncbi:MAG: hypothetical protein JO332_18170 [Planctomycetaceae bacterium]|nr:hypothetical protein [Planctomycetaceae bacterium]